MRALIGFRRSTGHTPRAVEVIPAPICRGVPHWLAGADIDRSGAVGPGDVLTMIELLIGAGAYEP